MNAPDSLLATSAQPLASDRIAPSIPELVAAVYESAPAPERGHVLEQLLRPLSVLSLVAIADGIFAKIRLRSGWQPLIVRLDDIQGVGANDIVALVDYVQQVSIEAVESLAQTLQASPVMADSMAVALLGAAVLRRRDTAGIVTKPRAD